jgi:hypothetical protein
MKGWGDNQREKISRFFPRQRERMDVEWRLKGKRPFSQHDWRTFSAAFQKTPVKSQ